MNEPCRRRDGSYRAFFKTRAEAELFAADPKNWPVYQGDVAHLCRVGCGYYHLSRPEWLFPEWLEMTGEDAILQ